jgi:16S rRNA (guanine527-N7)-methyltransferase
MPRPIPNPDLTADRAAALRLTPVSRETLARLDTFVETLLTWNARTNLIAASTVPHLWTRHVADSLQLLDLAPNAKTWVDLGSGAGFPGLMIAIALADTPGTKVHLVESSTKKSAFLREAARLTSAPAVVHAERIEKFVDAFRGPVDAVTARALAPLKLLLDQSVSLLKTGALGLFPKGQDVDAELTAATKYWNIKVNLAPSRTDPKGRIVVVQALEPSAGTTRGGGPLTGGKPARRG